MSKPIPTWLEKSCEPGLTEDFIRENANKVSWPHISRYQLLSESFIREFRNHVDWANISKYQKLSEVFIREFINNIDWTNIILYQDLSNDFRTDFRHHPNFLYLPPATKKIKRCHIKRLGFLDYLTEAFKSVGRLVNRLDPFNGV